MATLKQCDACHDTWNPEDHHDVYQSVDQMRCSVSVDLPRYTSHNWDWTQLSRIYELCQKCAREVVKLLEGLKPDGP